MYVFEPRTFGAGTYCSANYATTIDLKCDHCERGGGVIHLYTLTVGM